MKPEIMLILSENWTLLDKQDLTTLVDWAVIAEEAGIYGIMLSEHITMGPSAGSQGRMRNPRAYAMPGNQDPATPWPNSLILMSAIASRTSRIRLFGGAIIAPLRHPIQLAHELAALDLISQGRLIVQPTVSWHEDEYAHLGVPFHQRGKLLDEHLKIWKLLWTETPVSYESEFYQFKDVYMEPKPYRAGGPTLWFGGQGLHDPLLRRLVTYGDGFHPLGAPSDADIAMLKRAMDEAGRDYAILDKVGGIRAVFPNDDSPSSLADGLVSIPPQIDKGFNIFCVKPNQFIDDPARFKDFCDELVEGFSKMERP